MLTLVVVFLPSSYLPYNVLLSFFGFFLSKTHVFGGTDCMHKRTNCFYQHLFTRLHPSLFASWERGEAVRGLSLVGCVLSSSQPNGTLSTSK